MAKRKSQEGEINGEEPATKKVTTEESTPQNGDPSEAKHLSDDKSTKTTSEDDNSSKEEKVATEECAVKDLSDDINRLSKNGEKHTLKICSWNVAGLRAATKNKLVDYMKEEDADIICLQETKVEEKELPGEVLALKKGGKIFDKEMSGYHMYLYPAQKKGYSGTALWSKTKPLCVKLGMGIKEHDTEGRLITAEYEKFFVVTSYVPNSGKKLVNLDYRRTWNSAMKDYLNELKKTKSVIFCGDLNVAHEAIDLANPKTNTKNAGFTKEERGDFTELLADGYVDSFRCLYPEKTGAYTFWTYIGGARSRNVGWRLDYYVLSNDLEDKLCNSMIRSKVLGSDHCPIILTLAI